VGVALVITLHFVPYGDRAMLALIDHLQPEDRSLVLHYLQQRNDLEDVYLAEQHVLVMPFNQAFPATHSIAPATQIIFPPCQHTIILRWNGEDLEQACARLGHNARTLAQLYMQPIYQVSFLGFRPGFAYLRGLPQALQLPRRELIRPRVAGGTFAAGGPYVAIYPDDSPGGWWLLAQTVGVELFRAHPPRQGALFQHGDEIIFREATP